MLKALFNWKLASPYQANDCLEDRYPFGGALLQVGCVGAEGEAIVDPDVQVHVRRDLCR